MKVKLLSSLVLILLLMSSISFLNAQTAVTIGANYWNTKLDYSATDLEKLGIELDIEPGNMFGPYMNLRVGKVVLGSSMFFGDFTFNFGGLLLSDFTTTVKRTDLNFSLGIIFLGM